jgi:hypothetical protein
MNTSHINIWRLAIPVAMVGLVTLACAQPTPSPTAIPGKPAAFIILPADGSEVTVGQATTIQVNATDAQGVARIEIKVDGTLAGTTQSPAAGGQPNLTATQAWTFAEAGRHVIEAQAFNAAGQPSDLVAITVQAVEGVAQEATPEAAPPTAEATIAPPAAPPTPVPSADMEADTNRPGMDYKDFDLSEANPELCRSACLADPQCLAYTYVKPGIQSDSAHCWLKSGAPPAYPDTCCVSGIKPATLITPSPTAEPTRKPPRFLITFTPTAQPAAEWNTYRQGDRGPAVFAIQYLLMAENYSLAVDGIFGPETEATVKSFQGAEGLSVDGIVGPNTWTALIHGHTVRNGDRGNDVRAVQYLLKNAYGYDIAVDGIFGPKTEEAVKGFQTSRGLTVDGIVGPQTWKALIAGS